MVNLTWLPWVTFRDSALLYPNRDLGQPAVPHGEAVMQQLAQRHGADPSLVHTKEKALREEERMEHTW